jgi:hypothetical protein
MQLGLQLLENTINAIRSRIEVEKSERDRKFKELVAVAGSGIATVSLLKDSGKGCTEDFILQKVPLNYCKTTSVTVYLG